MGRALLVARLAVRDLRHRPAEAVLMLLAVMAATATLALGLVLDGVTGNPYQQTRAATRGPDVVASYTDLPPMPRNATPTAARAAFRALARARGVTGHDGPYPVAWATLRTGRITVGAMAEGRDRAAAPIDQPKLTQGGWVRPGAVVVERSFAAALGLRAGSRITLNRRPFVVAGIAVTAANAPYPNSDFATFGSPFPTPDCGMIWVTRADATRLATRALPLSYLENLRLARPGRAGAFVTAHGTGVLGLAGWQDIGQEDGNMVRNDQRALVTGSGLLALLALASVAVLVGGRMTEQTRRTGLLKAVGGTPGVVAVVLLGEHLAVALVAAAAGLGVGWLAAPLLSSPGSGLLGVPGAPRLTWSTAGWVIAVALAVAAGASLVPALRAARVSTVAALADAARPARRRALPVRLSRWLPVPLLIGLRVAARRPRRVALAALSVAITVTTVVAVVAVHDHQDQVQQAFGRLSALPNPRYASVDQILVVITIVMIALAALNALFITWSTALDARKSLALARALGATPGQVSAGLAVAQMLPAVPGALLGIPAGIALVAAVGHGGALTRPGAGALVAVALCTPLAVAALAAIPARIGAHRPAAQILAAEA
jgi:putative ABC transport system permease protein